MYLDPPFADTSPGRLCFAKFRLTPFTVVKMLSLHNTSTGEVHSFLVFLFNLQSIYRDYTLIHCHQHATTAEYR